MKYSIEFNRTYLTGKEMQYINQVVQSGKISGNGIFTQKCQRFFETRHGFKKALLTTSCTDALEMCAILADIQPGDEVILPSYTFVSTAIAFVRQGAKLVFADSRVDHPGINEDTLEALITEKTKVIVPVHYAGVACDMDKIMSLAEKYNILVVEDAAQAIESFYKGKPLGSIGHMATFSFHETKNINAGEGGLLAINDERFIERAEIIWEKGTNRAEFFRGEINKYGWVDTGSSFLPSDIIAAYLWAQIEALEEIQNRRVEIWEEYYRGLKSWAEKNRVGMPYIPNYATSNGHLFYLVFNNLKERTDFLTYLGEHGIHAVFHYLSLHKSPFYKNRYASPTLMNADRYTDCLVRLPLFYELGEDDIEMIIHTIENFKI